MTAKEQALALIRRWQRMPHPEHTGPALFDCERRQLADLIAQTLREAEGNAWTCGVGYAIAEMQRQHDQPTILVDVARAAGLTVGDFRRARLDGHDMKVLRKHLPKVPS